MTHPTITCDRFNEALADFLERSVSEPTRAAMEAHAVGCNDCGPLLADLRRLRIDAANLPELSPSRDLWSGIAERIEAPVVAFPGSPSVQQRRWGRYVSLGVAAAALIAVTATITHRMDGGPVDHTTGGPVDRLTGGLKANDGKKPAEKALRDLDQKMMAVELQLLSKSDLHSDDKWYVETYKVYLNLLWLSGEVGTGAGDVQGGADSRPTDASVQVLEMIEKDLAAAAGAYATVVNGDLPAFNKANPKLAVGVVKGTK